MAKTRPADPDDIQDAMRQLKEALAGVHSTSASHSDALVPHHWS